MGARGMWDRGAKPPVKYRAAGRKCPTREKEMRIGHGNKWKMKMHIIAV